MGEDAVQLLGGNRSAEQIVLEDEYYRAARILRAVGFNVEVRHIICTKLTDNPCIITLE